MKGLAKCQNELGIALISFSVKQRLANSGFLPVNIAEGGRKESGAGKKCGKETSPVVVVTDGIVKKARGRASNKNFAEGLQFISNTSEPPSERLFLVR